MTDMIRKILDFEVRVDKDVEGKALNEFQIEMIGSTSAADRDGEVIDPKGWDLKAFKKNPVILPQHDYRKPAIGKAVNIKVKDGQLLFKIEFPEEGVNPEADVYRKLYKSGFMNASSVGFIPKEWEDGDGKKTPFRKYTKTELLELSLVSVPANSEALVTGRSFIEKGIVTAEELKTVGLELESDTLPLEDEQKDAHVEAKGEDDPSYVYGKWQEEHTELHQGLETRIAFIEGFITGLQKEQELSNTKNYIADLLSGKAPKRTEKPTEKQENDVEVIKNIFKGE